MWGQLLLVNLLRRLKAAPYLDASFLFGVDDVLVAIFFFREETALFAFAFFLIFEAAPATFFTARATPFKLPPLRLLRLSFLLRDLATIPAPTAPIPGPNLMSLLPVVFDDEFDGATVTSLKSVVNLVPIQFRSQVF